MAATITMSSETDKKLTAIKEKRKQSDSFIKSKKDIIAEAINYLHKKEMKGQRP